MRKMKQLLANKGGETLVEVICATAIVLIALAALQGGVRFAHSASEKAGTIRKQTADLQEELNDSGITVNGTETYIFYLTQEEGAACSEEAFRIKVGLGEKTALQKGEDGGKQPVSFAVFSPLEEETG